MPVKKHPPTVFYWSKIRSKWMEAKLEMTALDTNDNVLYHDLDIKPRAIKREPVRFRLHQPLHETASGALIVPPSVDVDLWCTTGAVEPLSVPASEH